MLQFSGLVGGIMEAVNHSKNSAVEADTILKTRGEFEKPMSRGNIERIEI